MESASVKRKVLTQDIFTESGLWRVKRDLSSLDANGAIMSSWRPTSQEKMVTNKPKRIDKNKMSSKLGNNNH